MASAKGGMEEWLLADTKGCVTTLPFPSAGRQSK